MNASVRVRVSIPPKGLSLIEILVAMTISALLLLGLSQIFIGSKVAYSVQAGMSRSQENARFIFSFLEDNLRMAGYFGCGNEADTSLQYYNHILADPTTDTKNLIRFSRPLQGFEYRDCNQSSCSTDAIADPPAGADADWTPSLTQSGIVASDQQPVKGSDILVLRILSAAGAAVVSAGTTPALDPTTGTFNLGSVPNDPDFIVPGGVYAATNCRPRVDVFRASAGSTGNVVVGGADVNGMRNPNGSGPNDTWGYTNAEGEFKQPPLGTPAGTLNAEMHRADYLAIFVGRMPDGNPALKVRRYSRAAGTGVPTLTTEEIADGVEAMQLWYGVDNDNDGIADDPFVRASDIPSTGTPAQIDAAWRRVVSVRIALLMRSQDPVGAQARTGGNVFNLGGKTSATAPFTKMTRPDDHRFRDVYETTIALRNRLTGF